MDIFQSIGFWISFSAVLLVTLIVGGLLSATLAQCPAFGKLLLISVGVAFLGGLLGYWLIGRMAPAARAASQIDLEGIKSRVADIKGRLAQLSPTA